MDLVSKEGVGEEKDGMIMELIRRCKSVKNENGNRMSYSIFLCPECNNEVKRRTSNGNLYKTCGCSRTPHGSKGTRLFYSWSNMRQRCLNEKDKQYKNYGGRGVTVCREWDRFFNFKKWAEENGYNDNLVIDRIDNNKGYYPENCRWVSKTLSNRNKRDNVLTMQKVVLARYFHKELGFTVTKISKMFKINRMTMSSAINGKSWN